eukprot:Hpha_TRINITY_DN15572_c0_g2::TRINITY_DN15572_c0_g2_i3::g.106462::m.106462
MLLGTREPDPPPPPPQPEEDPFEDPFPVVPRMLSSVPSHLMHSTNSPRRRSLSPGDEEVGNIAAALREETQSLDEEITAQAITNLTSKVNPFAAAGAAMRRAAQRKSFAETIDSPTNAEQNVPPPPSPLSLPMTALGRRKMPGMGPFLASVASLSELAGQLTAPDATPHATLEWLVGRRVNGPADAADAIWRLPLPEHARLTVAALRVARKLWPKSGEFGIVRLVSRPAMREDGSGRNWTKSFAAAATKPAAEQVGAVVPTSPATINSPVSPVSPTNASPTAGLPVSPTSVNASPAASLLSGLSPRLRRRQPETPVLLVELPERGPERAFLARYARLWVRSRRLCLHRHLPLLWRTEEHSTLALVPEASQPLGLDYSVSVIGQRARVAMKASFHHLPPQGPNLGGVFTRRPRPLLRLPTSDLHHRLLRALRTQGGNVAPCSRFILTLPTSPGRQVISVRVTRGGATFGSIPVEGVVRDEDLTDGEDHDVWDPDKDVGDSVLHRAFSRDVILVPVAGTVCAASDETIHVEVVWTEPLFWDGDEGWYGPLRLGSGFQRGLVDVTGPDDCSEALRRALSVSVQFASTSPGLVVECTSHPFRVEHGVSGQRLLLDVDSAELWSPTDVVCVVRRRAASERPCHASLSGVWVPRRRGGLLMLNVCPPTQGFPFGGSRFRQCVVFLVDCSPTLSDAAMEATRYGILMGLKRLKEDDAVGILTFSSASSERKLPAWPPSRGVHVVGGEGGRHLREVLGAGLRGGRDTVLPGLYAAVKAAGEMLSVWGPPGDDGGVKTVVMTLAGCCRADETDIVRELSAGRGMGARVRVVRAGPYANALFALSAASFTRAATVRREAAETPADIATGIDRAVGLACTTWLTDVSVQPQGPVLPSTPAPPHLRQVVWQLPSLPPDLTLNAGTEVVIYHIGSSPSSLVVRGRLACGKAWVEAVPVQVLMEEAVMQQLAHAAVPFAAASVWEDVLLRQRGGMQTAGDPSRRGRADLILLHVPKNGQGAEGPGPPAPPPPDAITEAAAEWSGGSVEMLCMAQLEIPGAYQCSFALAGFEASRLLAERVTNRRCRVGSWVVGLAPVEAPSCPASRKRRFQQLAASAGERLHAAGKRWGLPLYDCLGTAPGAKRKPAAHCHSIPPLDDGSQWATRGALPACYAIPVLKPGSAVPLLLDPPF